MTVVFGSGICARIFRRLILMNAHNNHITLARVIVRALNVVLFACAFPCQAEDVLKSVEFHNASRWFDRLAIASVADKTFVRITIRDAAGAEVFMAHGFVLARYQYTYTILTTDLCQIRVPATGLTDWNIGVTERSLADYAERAARDVRIYEKESTGPFSWEIGATFSRSSNPIPLTPSARDFILAYICLERGHDDLGARLAVRSLNTKPGITRLPSSLQAELDAELYLVLMDRARANLSNPGTDRAEVLSSLEWIANNLTYRYDPSELTVMIDVLRRMVHEDRSGRWNRATTTEKRTADELIHDLRDEMNVEVRASQLPGYLSPAAQLVNLGPEAVPSLIDAIGDDRLTRRLFDDHPVYPKLRVATIGQLAIMILEEIAGEAMPVSYSPHSGDLEELAQKQDSLRRFWKMRAVPKPSELGVP